MTVLKVAEMEGKFNYMRDFVVKSQGGNRIYCFAIQRPFFLIGNHFLKTAATICCHCETGKPFPLQLLL
jgi:hypothetical protein